MHATRAHEEASRHTGACSQGIGWKGSRGLHPLRTSSVPEGTSPRSETYMRTPCQTIFIPLTPYRPGSLASASFLSISVLHCGGLAFLRYTAFPIARLHARRRKDYRKAVRGRWRQRDRKLLGLWRRGSHSLMARVHCTTFSIRWNSNAALATNRSHTVARSQTHAKRSAKCSLAVVPPNSFYNLRDTTQRPLVPSPCLRGPGNVRACTFQSAPPKVGHDVKTEATHTQPSACTCFRRPREFPPNHRERPAKSRGIQQSLRPVPHTTARAPAVPENAQVPRQVAAPRRMRCPSSD